MSSPRIIHVAQIELTPTKGMGRIACEWQAAARRAGLDFTHVGPEEVGPVAHRLLYPVKARKIADRLAGPETILLVHEPCAWAFRGFAGLKVAFSHGIENRGFDIERAYQGISAKRRVTEPLLRWLNRRGLTGMDAIFVSNHEDVEYLVDQKIMPSDRIKVFRNGVDPSPVSAPDDFSGELGKTIVFNASWLQRKGTVTLVRAAALLAERGIRPRWLVIGTGPLSEKVPADWPEALRQDLTIIPRFPRDEEIALLSRADIFVLPSYFEGQPLSLLQAMAAQRCCITSDCCGQRDIIRHGENGLLFPPGDASALADAIQQVWENPTLRRELGRAAGATVAHRTWESATDELMLWLKGLGEIKKTGQSPIKA
jgi:glycosyltransferase involved in cell wall biosynthesis